MNLSKCRASASHRSRHVVFTLLFAALWLPFPASAQTTEMEHELGMMTWGRTLYVLFDVLEYSPSLPGRLARAEMLSWYGGSRERVWLLADAHQNTKGNRDGEAEFQLLYGRLVDPFWDAVAGIRADRDWSGDGRERAFLVFGLIGLAPYRFEVQPALFISSKGEVSARVEASYQILVTQRLVAEPEIELNAALQKVPEAELRQGLNNYDLQLRVRYEFRREFAPYIGWSRIRTFGDGSSGSAETRTRFVVGLRLWR